ncbi:MAG: hypothetical protein ACOYNP_08850 [Gemmataceae bacterium]|jgi:hypothetical protein
MNTSKDSPAFSLASASMPLRLVVAVFLASVGIGYFSALVNLHFQEASPGNPLPDAADVIRAYHGDSASNQIARLLVAPDSMPFNGAGSMRGAFTEKRNPGAIKTGAEELLAQLKDGGYKDDPALSGIIREATRTFFDFERLALLAWATTGHDQKSYQEDHYDLPESLAKDYRDFRKKLVERLTPLRPVPPGDSVDPAQLSLNDLLELEEDGVGVSSRVRGILDERCVRCHDTGKSVKSYPLSRYEHVRVYLEEDLGAEKGKSLAKLALSTHVHLLGFSVLYGLTGLSFALSAYPLWMRIILAPAPLLLQVVDISFWWLARLDAPLGPLFAQGIMGTGGLVALSLGAQIVLGMLGLFQGRARLAMLGVFAIGGLFGLALLGFVVLPHLKHEKESSSPDPLAITGKP